MKETIRIADVSLDAVVKELPSRRAEVTEKPVEKGQDIGDHMEMKPTTIELTGTMSKDAANKLNILKEYQEESRLLRYSGRNTFDNMVITLLDTDHAKETKEGYNYTITLKQVQISQPETFEVKVANPKTKKQDKKTATRVKKTTNKGRQQPKKRKVSPPKKKQMSTAKRIFNAEVTQG